MCVGGGLVANFAAFASGKWECLKAEKCETEAERVMTLIREG